jgi:hypothetical protein
MGEKMVKTSYWLLSIDASINRIVFSIKAVGLKGVNGFDCEGRQICIVATNLSINATENHTQ